MGGAATERERSRLDIKFERTWGAMIAPGAPFEVEKIEVRGQALRHYVTAPMDARDMWTDAVRFKDRTYLVFGDERLGYGQAWTASASVAAWLAGREIRRVDRVGIAMRNYPECLLIYWGCLSIGVAVVGINGWWVADELAFALADAAPKVVFCDAERLKRIAACGDVARGLALLAVRAAASGEQIAWSDVMATPAVMPDAAIDPDGDASILYTSSTTGTPRARS